MARYFITGGSGFLGINLIRYLLRRKHEVISYDIEEFKYPERNQITDIIGDIRSYATLVKCMKGADIVVHAAAALPLYKPEDIRSTDITGTRNVCEASQKNKIKRLIHISSTAVYGIPDHHPLFENDRLDGVGEYGKAKIEAEKISMRYREKGLCIPIIRPKSFVGPERLGVFALFYDWATDKKGFPMIGDGKNRYQLLDVEDLCDAIYLCSTLDKNKVNDTFNIGAKEFTTMREDYQEVLNEAGFGRKIKGFPAEPMIWMLRLLETFHLSPLYKWVYETASRDSFVSIEKAQRILGFSPKFSNKQALVRNYNWYVQNRRKFKNETGISHRVPWKQGILGLVKKFF